MKAKSWMALGIGAGIGAASTLAAQTGLRFINPPGLYDASRYYTHVAVAPPGTTIYVAGQIGAGPDRKLVSTTDKMAQARQAFANLKAALAAAGATPDDVVKINLYIVDHKDSDLGPLSQEIARIFAPGKLPTSTLVPVTRLAAENLLFEVDAVAVLPGR